MKTDDKIQALIETRINGNSIKGNKTYENMLRSVTFKDIILFCKNYGWKWDLEDIGRSQKLDLINSIASKY